MWTRIPSWCGEEELTDEAHAFGHFDSEHGKMKPGAKWCISMQTSDEHWKEYSPDFQFLFWFRDDNSLGNNRKIAISVSKRTWKVALLYNGVDSKIEMELPSYIIEAIENEKENFKEKEINKIKSKLKLNPQTNRYDYDGDLDDDALSNFVSEDKDGFTINFGIITGDFDCYGLGLKSLKGAPREVGGDFKCWGNKLISLEGAPTEVGGSFNCDNNQLTSLKGAPKKVGKSFDCSRNQLTSLEGAPRKVGNLTKEIGNFYCHMNQLVSLEGAPTEVGGDFGCSFNQLTSLKGAPQTVGREFYCNDSHLTSLEGAPKTVGRDFYCHSNPDLHSLDGIGEVGGRIVKDF